MIGSTLSFVLLAVIIICVVWWFVLKKQINEEENDRIEPQIDSSFSVFSRQTLTDERNADFDLVDPDEILLEEKKRKEERLEAQNYDLFDEEPGITLQEPKQSFLTRLFGGEKKQHKNIVGDKKLDRPQSIKTVALILRAPDDQPYLGQEVLEVGEELKLMIGGEGFLQEIVTTYLGDEPMYSIAHMIHPGSFNDPDILDTEIPGLLFFAQVPGPDPQMNTVQNLLKAAAYFGQELGGTLLDETQRPLDSAGIQKLLNEVSELEQQAWTRHRVGE